eukprot:TRINITY_DN781808_c0_g1_i1.p1 TRINITY_DN781808_c0_g1~~TRINITY_DN781808_c0_g1_i1.p1  ORF type:complete len:328 (-),score=51.59 TRINITY_DN781808_c0_g1_i1:135-1118(-)
MSIDLKSPDGTSVPLFKMAKVFQANEAAVNSIDIHDEFKMCVTAGNDNKINVYNVDDGRLYKTLKCEDTGCANVCFTHDESSILCSTNVDRTERDSIKYLSLHDNQYIHTFEGHTKKVCSIHMFKTKDSFISTSFDGTARVWDLTEGSRRCSHIINLMTEDQPTFVSGDDKTIAIASNKWVRVFDFNNMSIGPFLICNYDIGSGEIVSFKVSEGGDKYLIGSNQDKIIVIDAFSGEVRNEISRPNEYEDNYQACFSPCGNFVLSGCETKELIVWDISSPSIVTEVARWGSGSSSRHVQPPLVCAWNPQTELAISCGFSTVFWLPPLE